MALEGHSADGDPSATALDARLWTGASRAQNRAALLLDAPLQMGASRAQNRAALLLDAPPADVDLRGAGCIKPPFSPAGHLAGVSYYATRGVS